MSETDYDIQRFMQIRDEIHDEIKKISPTIEHLKETTKRFIAHFEVFKIVSSNTERELASAIKNAAEEMAFGAAASFQELTQTHLEEAIKKLDGSIKVAQRNLEAATKVNHKKWWGMMCIACLFCGAISFTVGAFWANKNHTPLSPKALQTYQLGLELEKAWLKANVKDKKTIEQLLTKMQ